MTLSAKTTTSFATSVVDFMQSAPTNVWAMCAFAAAASILVTLVTLYLWPKEVVPVIAKAPEREPASAIGVWRLASKGVAASDIARRTGLSHDAVATILRARARPGTDRTASSRKSRPSAA